MVIAFFYFMVGFTIGWFVAGLLFIPLPFFRKVKVDYSIEAKSNNCFGIEKKYAVYTKRHFWSKWEQKKNFDDMESAKRYAERQKMIPKYY